MNASDEMHVEYRRANEGDIPQMSELRRRQLIDEGIEPSCDISSNLDGWFTSALSSGDFVQWLAVADGEAIASAGIVFYAFPPVWDNPSGVKGYITNMYTVPEYRGRGIATHMLGLLVEEARSRDVHKLWLGASRMGRPVYEAFGFEPADEWLEMDV